MFSRVDHCGLVFLETRRHMPHHLQPQENVIRPGQALMSPEGGVKGRPISSSSKTACTNTLLLHSHGLNVFYFVMSGQQFQRGRGRGRGRGDENLAYRGSGRGRGGFQSLQAGRDGRDRGSRGGLGRGRGGPMEKEVFS